jgi:hypothetical protein
MNTTPENLIANVSRVRTDDQRKFAAARWGVVPHGNAQHPDGRTVRVDRVWVAKTAGGELFATAAGRVVEETEFGTRFGASVIWRLEYLEN